MVRSKEVVAQLPSTLATGGAVALSPFDLACKGRSVPMVWFYRETLDPAKLLLALRETLKSYPVLCGRYGGSPPDRIELCNAGVPVLVEHTDTTLADAVGHLPTSTAPSTFAIDAHAPFVPDKGIMDPDTGSPDAPLLSIKITLLREANGGGGGGANGAAAGGGTAIGVLAQHGVLDADALIVFVRNWGLAFGGQALAPQPTHERWPEGLGPPPPPPSGEGEAAAEAVAEMPEGFKMRTVEKGAAVVPEFMPRMKTISGGLVCVVPFGKALLHQFKEAAAAELPPGAFVSTDDLLTARVWRALCTVRCTQLALPVDSDEVSTCSRASNFRQRARPPLGAGYCANGVSQVWTELRVRDLLSMSITEVALRLRHDLQAHTAEAVAARAAWLSQQQRAGRRTVQIFDGHALTFILSSWGFDWQARPLPLPPPASSGSRPWPSPPPQPFHPLRTTLIAASQPPGPPTHPSRQAAAFGEAAPLCYDHGANTPVVATLVPRPGGDGVQVYASGAPAG